MNRRLALALAVLFFAPLAARAQALKTDEDKTLYALGMILGENIKPLGISSEEFAKVRAGFEDAGLGKKPQIEMQVFGPKVSEFAKRRAAEVSSRESTKQKEAAKGFLAAAAKEPGAQSFPSGLIYKKIRDGQGASPGASSSVTVNYEGKLTDGTVFDSTYARNEPAKFPLSSVIACWTEGLQKMKVGEKAQLVCPASIAYGERGQGSIPASATLVFTVELLSIDQ